MEPPSLKNGYHSVATEQRLALFRRYGLDTWSRQEDVDEIAEIARAVFHETVFVTAVTGDQVVILGKAVKEGDTVDWDNAVRWLSPLSERKSAMNKDAGMADEVIVVGDASLRQNEQAKRRVRLPPIPSRQIE